VVQVLGINMSHYSAACLLRDGRLIAAIPEERLNRIKFSAAFPELAIRKVLEIGGVNPTEIDQVAIGTRCEMFDSTLAQRGEYRKTTRMVSLLSQILPVRVVESDWLKQFYIHTLGAVRRYQFMSRYLDFFTSLGIPRSKLVYYDHHTCHAAAAYYMSPWRTRTLIMTADGNGDGDCGTVWIGEGDSLQCKLRIPSIHSLGGLVSRTTKFMGMAPWQDEYKVMGLAPWGDKTKAEPVVERFRKMWEVDGLGYRNRCGYAGDALVDYLRRTFKNVRFDYLAHGIQTILEEILSEWVSRNATHYQIGQLAASGGVFLNVKANKRIMELAQIDTAFWFPAAGDDSITIGAGILGTLAIQKKQNRPASITPMTDTYWAEDITPLIEPYLDREDFTGFRVIRPENIDDLTAEILAGGEIVARCSGRMEFGPRALGNRSILADPSRLDNIHRLNAMIKCRDFWMPFAGTVLDTASDRYLRNPKRFPSPYMILSFDTLPETRRSITAATHQADGTIRPQILTESMNPGYYRVIRRFEELTGIGAVLNTSLNLHGDPVVNLPGEAMHVMRKSALNFLALGPCMIAKDNEETRAILSKLAATA